MWWNIFRGLVAAVIVVAVAELSEKHPRLGGLLLSLPIVSIVALVMAWMQHRDVEAASRLAKETLVLVPLGLPLFVPLVLADRIGYGFWTAIVLGIVLASSSTALWFWLGPKTL
jgi:hypothetical protein